MGESGPIRWAWNVLAAEFFKNRIALCCRLPHNFPMSAKVCSAAVNGIEAHRAQVEVNGADGDRTIVILGLPEAAVKESRDRVMTRDGVEPRLGALGNRIVLRWLSLGKVMV
jgi:hypothetical protein